MAQNDEFLDVLSDAAFQRLKEYDTQLTGLISKVKEASNYTLGSKTPSGSDSAIKALNDQLKSQSDLIQKLQNDLLNLSEKRKKVTTTDREAVLANQKLRQETDLQIKASGVLGSLYQALVARHTQLKKVALEAAAAFGVESAQFKKASAEANAVGNKLTESRKMLGQFTDDVGNYGGKVGEALGNIFSKIRILAYILPGIGIAGIFSLALDPLFDLIKGLDIFTDKLSTVVELQYKLNDARAKGTGDALNELDEFNRKLAAAADKNLDLDQRKEIVKELRKEHEHYLKGVKDESILNGENLAIYEKIRIVITAKNEAAAVDKELDTARERLEVLRTELAIREEAATKINQLAQERDKAQRNTDGLDPIVARQLADSYRLDIEQTNIAEKRRRERIEEQVDGEKDVKKKQESIALTQDDLLLRREIRRTEKAIGEQTQKNNILKNQGIEPTDDKERKKRERSFKESTKAAKDYEAAVYEVTKANLENAIKYNTLIKDEETKNFALRKDAAEQLFKDRLQVIQLEYNETKRANQFRLDDDIRIAKAERNNVLNDKDSTASQRLEAQKVFNEKIYGLNRESTYKLLLNDIKYNDALKGLKEDEFKIRKEVQDKIDALADQRETSIVSKQQLDNIRQLNLLLTNVTPGTSNEVFKAIYDLRKHIAEDSAKQILEIQIRANARELENIKASEQKKREAEEAITRLGASSGPLTEVDQKKLDSAKNLLDSQLLFYQTDSKAYEDNEIKRIELAKQYADLETKILEDKEKRTRELIQQTQEYFRSFSEDFFQSAGVGGLSKFFDFKYDEVTGKYQSTFDKLIEGAGTTAEKFAVAFNAISEVGQEVFNMLNQNSDRYFENEKKKVEERLKIANEYAGKDLTTGEENEAAKKELRRQADAEIKEINRRQAEQKLKLAKFNIAVDTAQAAIAFLAEGGPAGIVGAAFAVAFGAAQIALINAQEVPELWKGTDNANEGWHKVDELGPELQLDRFGKIKSFGSEKGANLRYLKSGDKIIPADITEKIMFNNNFNKVLNKSESSLSNVTVNGLSREDYMAGVNQMRDEIKNFSPIYIEKNHRGEQIFRRRQGARMQSMNNRQFIKGGNH